MAKVSPLVLSLPLPPAADLVTAQLAWRKRALAELDGQSAGNRGAIGDHARVRLLAGIVHARTMIELAPVVVGMLVEAGMIASPAVVSDLETRWDRTIEPGRMRIELARAVPPLRRIGAATRQRIREKTVGRWAANRTVVERYQTVTPK
jgi:hypothetical protein